MSPTSSASPAGGTSRLGPDAAWRRTNWGDALGEFAGTFVLIMFGLGSVAMTVAALPGSGRGETGLMAAGDWLVIALGWGLGVTFGVYVAGGITGAHLNPAVTLAMAWRRGFSWAKVPWYILAQVAGAFVAAALISAVYGASIDWFERTNEIVRGTLDSVPTFSIFATFPAGYFENWWGPFLDEMVGTALLVMAIFALTDTANQPPRANIAPFIVGLVVVAIGLSFGANSGYAINPARDLGPRLWTWIDGWKSVAVPGDYGNVNFYMWIPIVGPITGGLIGAWLYDFFIGDVLKARGVPGAEIEEKGRTAQEGDPTGQPKGQQATGDDADAAARATRSSAPPPERGAP